MNFEQRLNKLSIGLSHYESLISTFSPIIRIPSRNPNLSAAPTLSHSEALRYLSGLPANDEQNSKEGNVRRNIGLVSSFIYYLNI